MIPKECKRQAEVDFPTAVVSAHAAREKLIRHGHPSTLHLWWARRSLASCRAMLLALLLPDPCDEHCPPAFKDKSRAILKGFGGLGAGDAGLRKALLGFIGDVTNWDVVNNPRWIGAAPDMVKAAHPDEPPLVRASRWSMTWSAAGHSPGELERPHHPDHERRRPAATRLGSGRAVLRPGWVSGHCRPPRAEDRPDPAGTTTAFPHGRGPAGTGGAEEETSETVRQHRARAGTSDHAQGNDARPGPRRHAAPGGRPNERPAHAVEGRNRPRAGFPAAGELPGEALP